MEAGLRKRSAHSGQKCAARQRLVSRGRRHAARFSRPESNRGGKQHGRLGRCRLRWSACSTSSTRFTHPSGSHRANRTWTDDCCGAKPVRRVDRSFAERIPHRLSATERMDGALGAAHGDSGGERTPVLDTTAWRRGIGPADRLRERRESAARARKRKRTRNGCSPSAGSRTRAPDSTAAHRKRASFVARRNSRSSNSFLCQGVSAANCARQCAAAQRSID